MQRKDAPDAWLLSFATAGNEASEPALVESATRLGGLNGAFTWRSARLAEIDVLRRDPTYLTLCQRPELGLWKPAVIIEQLRAIPPGDLLLYHDAGKGFWGDFAFRASVRPVIEWAVESNRGLLPGVWIPEDGRNARWTPAAAFRAMQSDAAEYWDTPQVGTVFSLWRHTDYALELLDKWAKACMAVYTAEPSGQPAMGGNSSDFVSDRGAQSILTNLLIREGVGCYGKSYESSAVQFHPVFAPIPASDIGGLLARIRRDRATSGTSVDVSADASRAPQPAGRRALFTSIPPTLDRRSAHGFQIGAEYQEDCVRSWLDCGFEVYSVHFAEEIDRIKRLPGVDYVGMERTPDDRPEDRKPSLRAILSLVQQVGADLSGLINSDILLLNPPGWIATVEREVTDSVIAFSRFEIDEERTCVGAAPWGIDLFFLDRRYIAGLKYCGMRIGETWWDYWLPLSCWFQGATIKHVGDYVALHLDHPVVSSEKVQEYGLRFLRQVEGEVHGRTDAGDRLAGFHRYCAYRIAAEKQRLRISDEDSRAFVERILNPTVWAAVQDLLHQSGLAVVAKASPHHRILASTIVDTARIAEAKKSRPAAVVRSMETIPASYWRLIGVPHDQLASGATLVDYVNLLKRRWPYRLDLWVSNAVRRVAGKPAKVRPPAATTGEAVDQILRLRRHVLWRLFARIDGAIQRVRWATAKQSRAHS